MEDDVVATGNVDVSQMQERSHSFLGYRTRLGRSCRFGAAKKLSGNFFVALDVLCIDHLWIEA
jgi:hypothetical protein